MKRMHLIALKLKVEAFAWWEQLGVNRQRNGKKTYYLVGKNEEIDEDSFLPPNYEQTLYNQYHNCQQGTRTFADYIK